jgi:hypothetical protein
MTTASARVFSRRLWVLSGLLLLVLAACGWYFLQSAEGLPRLAMYDFAEYWAAGHLEACGENPYDPDRIHELEQQLGRKTDAVLMWNPPWTLPLVIPFGVLPAPLAHLLWLLVQFAVLVLCAELLWRFHGGNPERRGIAWLITFTFLPTLFALTAGQISPLLLLGATGFLCLQQQRRDFAAGAAAALLGIKPHLVWLFWPALLLWCWRERRWRVIAGGITAGILATLAAVAFNPAVLGQYWYTLTTRPPAQYVSPTFGSVLRMAFGPDFRWQFAVLLPGLVWFVWWQRRDPARPWADQLPALLLASLLTASYGAWPFDLVLVLVPVLGLAAQLDAAPSAPATRLALVAHLAINGLALWLLLKDVEFFWFIWMTPALACAWWLVRREVRGRVLQPAF